LVDQFVVNFLIAKYDTKLAKKRERIIVIVQWNYIAK